MTCPQIKEACRRDSEEARKGLVLKLRNLADVTSKRHAKGKACPQIKGASRRDSEEARKREDLSLN